MTEEEKKAIEIIKEYKQDFICDKLYPYLVDSIKIILDLIERQQKEIETLRGITEDDLPF